MNPPADDPDFKPKRLEEEKEGGALFHCDLYDADIVHKIAEEFLPGLASACIDNTTGGLFRNPASVAVDIRREMVDYLIQRSENFVAESIVLDGGPNEEVPEDPYDIISDFVDDFSGTKRNFFSRVSGWLLSDKREDRIDDFVQEMEINGFWLLNRRESVAQTLLKNVDFKNIYHCNMSFKSPGELEEHKVGCGFRTMICTSEGCNARFSAAQADQHDSICPFKILRCEQNCAAMIMRREMDRHCITICPMKLVKCPFYSVGCHSSIPQCTIEQHRSENLSSHLVYILQAFHKEASEEDLKERAQELIELSSPGKLAVARDARALSFLIKDLEAKLGPLKVKPTESSSDDEKEEGKVGSPTKEVKSEEEGKVGSPTKEVKSEEEGKVGSPTKEVKSEEEAPRENVETVNSPSKSSDDSEDETSREKHKLVEESPANVTSIELENERNVEAISVQEEDLKQSSNEVEDRLEESLATSNASLPLEPQLDKNEEKGLKESSHGGEAGLAEEAEMEKKSEDHEMAEQVKHGHSTPSSPVRIEEKKTESDSESEEEHSSKSGEESKES